MKLRCMAICCLLILNLSRCDGSVSVGATAVGLAGAALYAGFDKLRCTFYECCSNNANWVKPNMTALNIALEAQLHGQHLVRHVVSRALKAHLQNDNPSKLNLQDWIRGNVSRCERSLFIFDEIDKMPLGMINGIKPFIDYHESINGVDFRKSIFIFLSNTGGPDITRAMLKMWRSGKNREDISMVDLEHLTQLGAFNEEGGLHKSEIIQHSLVDHYIPFLPLERRHIELCARDEIIRRGHKATKDLIKKVADEMMYFPPENKLFSTTGCKRISQKVGFLLADEEYNRLFD
ncbi:torsin-1B-like isoform X2 [Homarus americanus]|uniref:torsin-1B-like isoform X2 n=1 Tax=Homarus americanus TaxID=6706 RepID=UPI001C448111|nr:torsin-1B-like isoform X2 [Homarus americanus]